MNTTKPMNRLNQILIGLLVVQIGVGVAMFWPRNAASQTAGPLLQNFSADSVSELVISDAEDNRVALAKQGDSWVLPEADDYPAQSQDVDTLVENLAGIETNRLVTETGASHGRLQVADDDFNRRLEITMADGNSHTLFVGTAAGAGATHVRANNQPEVYLAGNLNAWEVNAQPSGWIDTLYFTVPQTATTQLTLQNENGTFEFEQAAEGWTMQGLEAGETFNESAFTSLLSQASSVRMTEPLGKQEEASFGLDDPLATVTLQTDSETLTLRIGAQNPNDNSYVVKASNSPYYVRVAEFTGNNFVNKTRDDFLQAPPTPTTEPDTGESQ